MCVNVYIFLGVISPSFYQSSISLWTVAVKYALNIMNVIKVMLAVAGSYRFRI